MNTSKIFPIIIIIIISILICITVPVSFTIGKIAFGIFEMIGLGSIILYCALIIANKTTSYWLLASDLGILIGIIGILCSTLSAIGFVDIIFSMLLAFILGGIFTSQILRIFLTKQNQKNSTILNN